MLEPYTLNSKSTAIPYWMEAVLPRGNVGLHCCFLWKGGGWQVCGSQSKLHWEARITIVAGYAPLRVCLGASSRTWEEPFLHLSPIILLRCCWASSRRGSYLAPLSLVTAGGAYIHLDDEEFMHYIVNHSVSFINSCTGNYTSTIRATLKHVKVSLSAYNQKVPYIFYLVKTMFGALCRARKFNPFTMFIFSVRSVDWSLLAPPTTVTLIPLCIFCAGNFPAVVGLFYVRAQFIILHSVCEIPLETNSRVILKFILAPSYLM
jgi:hypothetical protein